MAYFTFVSYARVNVDRGDPEDPLLAFLKAVEKRIKQHPLLDSYEPMFFDQTNIETGRDWNDELSPAAAASRVALAIYTPAYFTREYCGREFQVFRDRRQQAGSPRPVSIIPVLWQPCTIPPAVASIQWTDAALPPSYEKEGLEIVVRLGSKNDYERAVITFAKRILDAATQDLPALSNLDLRSYPSAFSQKQNAPGVEDDLSSDSLKKTRFVFLSGQGWDWTPYGNGEPIGVIAMDVAVKLRVRFEEIQCNARLQDILDQTEDTGVPTLLIPDPSGVESPVIKTEMEKYDASRLYDNCGLVIPWNTPSPGADSRWPQIKNICRRKIGASIQNHDWTSAVSKELFESRAIAIIEGIRLKRMNKLLASNTDFAKADDPVSIRTAEQNGLNVSTAPQVSNVVSAEAK